MWGGAQSVFRILECSFADGRKASADSSLKRGIGVIPHGLTHDQQGVGYSGRKVGVEDDQPLRCNIDRSVKKTAVFLTGHGRLTRSAQILASIGKQTRSRNQRQVRKPSHGFLYDSRRHEG